MGRFLQPEKDRIPRVQCPDCDGPVHASGFNGNPFCWKCYHYVKPIPMPETRDKSVYLRVQLQKSSSSYIIKTDSLEPLIEELTLEQVGDMWTLEIIEMYDEDYENLPEFPGH